jgi:hypothetical protein
MEAARSHIKQGLWYSHHTVVLHLFFLGWGLCSHLGLVKGLVVDPFTTLFDFFINHIKMDKILIQS